jgi:hypothetical protein
MMARALQAILRLIPDLDRASLSTVFRFLDDARAGRDASLTLPEFGLQMRLPAGSPLAVRFAKGPLVEPMWVECGARLGQWETVRASASSLLDQRPRSAPELAMQAAASHDFAFAERALAMARDSSETGRAGENLSSAIMVLRAYARSRGSVPPPVVAGAYIRIAAWGKAYLVLQPLFPSSTQLGGEATKLMARVAFCAGDKESARSLLSHAPGQAKGLFTQWAREMQWIDAPRMPSEPPLPASLRERVEKQRR